MKEYLISDHTKGVFIFDIMLLLDIFLMALVRKGISLGPMWSYLMGNIIVLRWF